MTVRLVMLRVLSLCRFFSILEKHTVVAEGPKVENKFLQNVGIYQRIYTMTKSKRTKLSTSVDFHY
jgi:hypothetical protein